MTLNSRMEPYCSNLNALHEVFCTYCFRAGQANKSQRKLDVVRKLEVRVEKQTLSKMSQKLKTNSSHSSGNELTGPFGKGTQGIPKVEGNGHLYVFETRVSPYHCSPH